MLGYDLLEMSYSDLSWVDEAVRDLNWLLDIPFFDQQETEPQAGNMVEYSGDNDPALDFSVWDSFFER